MINCIHSLTMHSHKIILQVNIYKRQLLFSCSVISDIAMSWTAARQASLSFTISQSLLKLKSIESMMPSNHLILCWSLLLLSSIFPSIRIFFIASGGQCIGASASHLPKNIQGWFPLGLTGLTSLLLFNMLSRFVIAFLPRSKCLLILRLQLLSTVILEPEIINLPMFLFFPINLPWSDGARCHELSFLNAEF